MKEIELTELKETVGEMKTYNLTLLKNGRNYFANGILVSNESEEK